uniref:AT30578p n=1 Tax=Drosophila melanogaster TaxID=7227 RepID=Q8T8T1_DROME|nr:AT30578p [Drosophila melanogaster]
MEDKILTYQFTRNNARWTARDHGEPIANTLANIVRTSTSRRRPVHRHRLTRQVKPVRAPLTTNNSSLGSRHRHRMERKRKPTALPRAQFFFSQ